MQRIIKRALSLLTVLSMTAGMLPQWIIPAPEARAAGLSASSSSVLQIVTGEEHTVVLMEDQSVWAWGRNQYGQLGDGTTYTRTMPTQVIPSEGWGGATVTSLAAGANHTLAVLADGRVIAWGNNSNGQLGDSTTANRSNPALVTKDGKPFLVSAPSSPGDEPDISAGFCHTMAISTDGYLYGWGLNSYGQLGTGNNSNKITPTRVNFYDYEEDPRGVLLDTPPATDFVAAGYNHTLAYSGGTLYAFGCNTSGQLGVGDLINRNKPAAVFGDISPDLIRCGNAHSMALVGSTLYGWGSNAFGQISLSSGKLNITEPVEMLDSVADMQGGYFHTVMLLSDDTVFTFGYNSRGQLGNGVAELVPGANSIMVDGEIDPDEFDIEAVPEQIPLEAQKVSAGYYFSAVIDTEGNLWLWGDNGYGQLGDATQIRRPLPNPLPSKLFYQDDVFPVNKIEFSDTKLMVGIGPENGATITSIIMPANPLYDKLTWTVSNNDIVKVVKLPADPDSTSVYPTESVWVYGNKKTGTAVVTATAYNGKKMTCTVSVKPTAEVVNITNKPTKMMALGTKTRLKAEVLPNGTFNKGVYWSLVDDLEGEYEEFTELPGEPGEPGYGVFTNEYASIDQNGWFTAIDKGTVYVQAQSVMDPKVLTVIEIECGYYATSTSIFLDDYGSGPYPDPPSSVTLYIDGRPDEGGSIFYGRQLYAVTLPYGDGSDRASQNIKWSCLPETVCRIDEDGFITPMKPGKATVYAKTTDRSNVYAKLEVVVVPIGNYIDVTYPPTVRDENENLTATVNMGVKLNFRGKVSPGNASQKISWRIENENPASAADKYVATIDEKTGAFTGRGVGTCEVVGFINYPTDETDYPLPQPDPTEVRIYVNVINPITKVIVMPSNATMTAGDDDLQLTAGFSPANPTITEVDWSSSNENAATVDEDGIVTAVAPGTAKIYATAKDGTGKRAYSTITVMASPTAIELNWKEYTLSASKTFRLKAKVIPYPGAYQSVKWLILNDGFYESDMGAATVSSNGVVKAFGTGTVYVVAVSTLDESIVSEPCKITCVVPITSFSVKPSATVLTKGGSQKIAVNIIPVDATDKKITMYCDYPGITAEEDPVTGGVLVENGAITLSADDSAFSGGPYSVKFVCGSKSATVRVTIKDAPEYATITSIAEGDMVWKGKSISVKAKVEPSTADQSVTWYSSNEEVAKFDAKGNLKGVSPGEFEIYCITNTPVDGSDTGYESDHIQLTCVVPVSSVKVSASKTIELMLPDSEAEVDVTILPADAYDSDGWTVTARRGDNIVELEQATTSSLFIIRPVSAGTDTITVSLGGKSATVKVSVWDPPDSVEITTTPRASDSSLIKGKTLALKAKVYNSDGKTGTVKQAIYWESDDESIAKVSKTGIVSVTGQGETFIRAYALDAEDNEIYSDEYYISTLLPITGLQIKALDAMSLTMYPGDSLTQDDFNITIRPIPEAYLGKTIKWKATSSNKKIAAVTMDDPLTGAFTITAEDVTATTKCKVTISVGDTTTGIKSATINVVIKPDPSSASP